MYNNIDRPKLFYFENWVQKEASVSETCSGRQKFDTLLKLVDLGIKPESFFFFQKINDSVRLETYVINCKNIN